MKKLLTLIKEIPFDIKIFVKSPKHRYYKYFKCIIPHLYGGVDKDLIICEKWINITFPNKYSVLYVLMETFLRELFENMKWLDRVLDIWGFIGESSIYLSMFNKEVISYELSPTNFYYLKKNCESIKNIKIYNWCIWTSNDEFIEFFDVWDVSSINKTNQKNWKPIKIKNYNIIKLLNENAFDWLKLDIEWWEYSVLDSIISNWLFNFKKGIIEFHDLNQTKNLNYTIRFIDFLKNSSYKINIYDNEKNSIKIWDIVSCNIFFERIP